MSARVAFDPALPVVVTGDLDLGVRKFVAGESLPWRELGISEADLFAFWRCALIAFEPVAVETTKPTQERKRRDRR